MESLILLTVVVSSVWLACDAYHEGRSWGSIIGWVCGCLLLWIITFPFYLVDRRKFASMRDDSTHEHHDAIIAQGAHHRHV